MASEGEENNQNNNDQNNEGMTTPHATPQKPTETPTKTPSSSSSKKKKSSSKKAESTTPSKIKNLKVCCCGRGMACAGMTQAFRLLGDIRCHFVELPRYRPDPPSFKYQFRNNMRASYIRNLQKHANPNLDLTEFEDFKKRRFLALHHFQPQVVKAFHENPMTASKSHRVPISITEHEVKEKGIKMDEEDRILSVNGNPTGGFYFAPNYSPTDVHQDLKDLVRSKRLVSEGTPQKEETPPKPKDIQFPNYSKKAASPDTQLMDEHLQDQRQQRTLPKKEELDEHLREQRNQRTPLRPPVAGDNSSDDEAADAELEEVPSKDFDDIVTGAEPSGEGGAEESNFDDLWQDENAQADDEPPSRPQQDDDRQGPDDAPQRRKSELSALTLDEHEELSPVATKSEDAEEKESQQVEEGDHVVEEEEAEAYDTIDQRIEETTNLAIQRELFPDPETQESDDLADSEMLQRVRDQERRRQEEEDRSDLDNDMLAPATSREEGDSPSGGGSPSKLTARNSDHPWDLSKYRKVELETRKQRSSAAFIDPTTPTQSKDDSMDSGGGVGGGGDSSHGISTRMTPAGMKIIDEARETSAGMDDSHRNEAPQQYLDFYDEEEDAKARNKYHASFAISQSKLEESEESKFSDSTEGISPNAIGLSFQLPGADPTLRIQVHNDLIALESRRRSEISTLLLYHREKWQAAKEILLRGVYNVEFAERLVSGFAQAGMMFADSLQAISEDRFLDDRGKTVKSTFVQNRLKNRRSKKEYSIENRVKDDDFGQSTLLKALIESQLSMAQTMDESAQHLMDVMLPEMTDLRMDIQGMAAELDKLGEGIIGQLVLSEQEVKNIWDVFDALVTGDLMEYSVHGSSHGSMHGGSFHSVGSTSLSLHGVIPDSSSVVSNGTSPIKSKFKQLGTLGSIEDGWLVELIYKSAISCQRAVFTMAETELNKLYKEICIFEERRLQKLHPLMIAFAPRQRKLFSALPETLKGVLDDLVGMRIDEESLQAHIDETLQNRSRDRLKGSEKHRSSIMNRSRVKTANDTVEAMGDIERIYGSPFFSSMIVLSKVLELKPFGLGGIVKTAYRLALVVVTNDGNLHVFTMPKGVEASLDQSPLEAFRLLYPSMQFDAAADWKRKGDITKKLTPSISLKLKMCTIRVSNIRKRELEIIQEEEEEVQQRNSFFGKKILKAVKDGGQGPTKCTLRLPDAAEAAEWADVLTNTKLTVGQKTNQWR